MPPLEGRKERPVEAGECLLPPRAHLDLLDALGPEVPDRFLRDRLRHEEHGIERSLAKRQDALGEMPTETAEPAVGMPELLEVEHDARPAGTCLLGGPLCEEPVGEHG